MNNQKNKNAIDLSQFPIGRKEKPISPQPFSLEGIKRFWSRMDKKNRIYALIFIISLIFITILLISLFVKTGREKIIPTRTAPPVEYAPPAEYPLSPGEKYTPPFP